MRPITLTMNAFGTYLEETTIPFEQFGTSGLVLITGDTGAGKTTILMPFPMRFMGRPAAEIKGGSRDAAK